VRPLKNGFDFGLEERENTMKKILSVALLLALLTLALASCKIGGGGGSADSGTSSVPEGSFAVYSGGTPVNIIRRNDISTGNVTNLLSELRADLQTYTKAEINIGNENSAPIEHEIVFGDTNREISDEARAKLERAMARYARGSADEDKTLESLAGYAVYAEGGSVGIVWTHDNLAEKAIKYFVDNYAASGSLVLKDGYVKTEVFDYVSYLRELDAVRMEEEWALVEEQIGSAAAQALKDHYALYTDRFYLWMVDLYDPGIGGYYYSSSARDTLGYLPDIESTAQALQFLDTSGMTKSAGGWEYVIPEEMKTALLNFALSLQSPYDGFFYHPQWDDLEMGASRLGRDTDWATTVISKCGGQPYWNTRNNGAGKYGAPGKDAVIPEGWTPSQNFKGAPAPAAALSSSLYRSSVAVAVSKVVSVASEGWTWQFQTYENWVQYVDSFDFLTNSYSAGNTLAAQSSQIKKRDAEDGRGRRFANYLRQKLDNGVFPHNGLWQEVTSYSAVNGLMKLSALYRDMGWELKYSDKALMSAIQIALLDGPDVLGKQATGSVDVYNPWVCIANIKGDARKYHDQAYLDSLQKIIDSYTVDIIRATTRKTAKFEKENGAFGYTWGVPPLTSQGAPVSVAEVVEGDVNGGCIAVTGVTRNMCDGLGITMPSIFGDADLYVYLKRLNELEGVIKKGSMNAEAVYISFENDFIGNEEPASIESAEMNTGDLTIVERPFAYEGNEKALRFRAKEREQGDIVRFESGGVMEARASSFVLEFDMFVESANISKFGMQVKLDDSYCFTLGSSGKSVTVGDLSNTSGGRSQSFGVTFPMDEWHTLRFEYYYAAKGEDVRIKFFLDGNLRYVSDNYYGPTPLKQTSPQKHYVRASFYSTFDSIATFYLDDITLERSVKEYVEEPTVNPDRIKDFERAKDSLDLPYGATLSEGTAYEIVDQADAEEPNKILRVNSGATTLTISSVTCANPNIYSTTLDLLAEKMTNGKGGYAATLNLRNADGALVSYALVADRLEEKDVLLVKPLNTAGEMGDTVCALPVGEWVNVGIRFYNDHTYFEKDESLKFVTSATTVVSEFYVNGERVGTTDEFVTFAALTKGFTSFTLVTATAAEYCIDNIIAENLVGELLDENGEAVAPPEVERPIGGPSSDVEPDEDYNGVIDFEDSELGTPSVPGLATTPNKLEYRNEMTVVDNAPEIEEGTPNKALMMYTTKSKVGGNVLNVDIHNPFGQRAKSYVFEFDMNVNEVRNTSSTMFQIRIVDAYMIYVGYENGRLFLGDSSNSSGSIRNNRFGIYFDTKEWVNLRIEYYPGTKDTVRAKVYLDGYLVYISDNYYGPSTTKPDVAPGLQPVKTTIYSLYDPGHTTYFDNFKAYATEDRFVNEEVVNPDRIKDFERAKNSKDLPGGVSLTDGTVFSVAEESVGGRQSKLLHLNHTSGTTMSVQALSKAGEGVYSASLDLFVKSLANGSKGYAATLGIKSVKGYVVTLALVASSEDTVTVRVLDSAGRLGDTLATIPANKWVNIGIEFYNDYIYYEKDASGGYNTSVARITAKLYVDGTEVGSTDVFANFSALSKAYASFELVTQSAAELYVDNIIAETLDKELVGEDGSVVEKPEIAPPTGGVDTDVKPDESYNGIIDFEDSEIGVPNVPGIATDVNNEEYRNEITVENAPELEDGVPNKALKMYTTGSSVAGNQFNMDLYNPLGGEAKSYVFEMDINIAEVRKASNPIMRIKLGEAYCIYVGHNGGRFSFSDVSNTSGSIKSNSFGVSFGKDEWHRIRIEYYPGTAETVRIKFYFDGKLAYISDNYFGPKTSDPDVSPKLSVENVAVYSFYGPSHTTYFDNLKLYASDVAFADEPLYEVKYPDVYDFEDTFDSSVGKVDGVSANIEDTAGGDKVVIVKDPTKENNRVLKIDSVLADGASGASASFALSDNVDENANAYVFELDLNPEDLDSGSVIRLLIGDSLNEKYVFGIELVANEQSAAGERVSQIRINNVGLSTANIGTVPADADLWYTIRIEHFRDAGYTRIYVNGTLVGTSLGLYDSDSASYAITDGIVYAAENTEGIALIDNVSVRRELVRVSIGSYDFEASLQGATVIEGVTLAPNTLEEGNSISVGKDPTNPDNNTLNFKVKKSSVSGNSAAFSIDPTAPKSANCTVFEFDFLIEERKDGYIQIRLKNGSNSIFSTTWYIDAGASGYTFRVKELGGDLGTLQNVASDIPIDGWTTLRFEYYAAEKCMMFYVDGVYYGATCNGDSDYLGLKVDNALVYTNYDATGSFHLDNVRLTSVDKEFNPVIPVQPGYTFDGIADGALESTGGITAEIKDGSAGSDSLTVSAGAEGSADKKLVLSSAASENGGMTVAFQRKFAPTGLNANRFVFDLSAEARDGASAFIYLSSASEVSGAALGVEAVFTVNEGGSFVTFYELTAGGRGVALTDMILVDGIKSIALEYYPNSAFGKLYVNDTWQNDVLAVYNEANKALDCSYGIVEIPAASEITLTLDNVYVFNAKVAEKQGDPNTIVLGGTRGAGVYYQKGVTEGYGVETGLVRDLANIAADGNAATDVYEEGRPLLGIVGIDRDKALYFSKDESASSVDGGVQIFLPEGSTGAKYYLLETDLMGFVSEASATAGGGLLSWQLIDKNGNVISANGGVGDSLSTLTVGESGFVWGSGTLEYGYWNNIVLVYDVENATVLGYLNGKGAFSLTGRSFTGAEIGGISLSVGPDLGGVELYLDNTCFLALDEVDANVEKGLTLSLGGTKGTGVFYNSFGGADYGQPSGRVADSAVRILGSNENAVPEGAEGKVSILVEKLNGDKVLSVNKPGNVVQETGPLFGFDKTNGGKIFVFETDIAIHPEKTSAVSEKWFRFQLAKTNGSGYSNLSSGDFQSLIYFKQNGFSFGSADAPTVGEYDTWYNLRCVLDLANLDENGKGSFRIYLDGELIGTTAVKSTVVGYDIGAIRIHTKKEAGTVSFYFDNTHAASYTELPSFDGEDVQ